MAQVNMNNKAAICQHIFDIDDEELYEHHILYVHRFQDPDYCYDCLAKKSIVCASCGASLYPGQHVYLIYNYPKGDVVPKCLNCYIGPVSGFSEYVNPTGYISPTPAHITLYTQDKHHEKYNDNLYYLVDKQHGAPNEITYINTDFSRETPQYLQSSTGHTYTTLQLIKLYLAEHNIISTYTFNVKPYLYIHNTKNLTFIVASEEYSNRNEVYLETKSGFYTLNLLDPGYLDKLLQMVAKQMVVKPKY